MSKTTLHRLSTTLGVLILFLSLTLAQGDGRKKLSPWLRQLISTTQQQARKAQAAGQPTTPKRVTVFIRTSDAAALTSSGCTINATLGNGICIATVPVDSLESLAAKATVSRIEADRAPRLMNDTMAAVINVTPVYEGKELPQAFTGKDVIVGVQDADFDLTHPSFYTTDGSQLRIKRFWDQNATEGGSNPPYEDGEGRLFASQEDILAVAHSAGNTLAESHGTHVTGIAAGSGHGTAYRGMAFESDIALVDFKADEASATTANTLLGFKYLFDYADEQQKPCVINYSAGNYQRMDDANELYAEALEDITGPGRIIVAAAGNSGKTCGYMKKSAEQELASTTIGSEDSGVELQLLADGDFQIRFIAHDILDPANNDTLTVASTQLEGATETPTFTLNHPGEGDPYGVEFDEFDSPYFPERTGYNIIIAGEEMDFGDEIPVSVELMGEDTEVEILTAPDEFEFNKHMDMRADANNSYGLSCPSNFPFVISVGATAYRTGYQSVYTGKYVSDDCGTDGEIADFSSRGPVLDRRIKPDVSAPGANIHSSLSSYFRERILKGLEDGSYSKEVVDETLQVFTAYTQFNGRTYPWGSYSGTSMASPAVTGAVALWLQANPELTAAQCIDIFSKTCRQPDATLAYPNTTYGYGQIDVYAGLLEALNLTGISALSKRQPSALTFALSAQQLRITGAEEGKAFTVSVYSTAGMQLYRQTFSGGAATIDLSAMPAGVLAVQVDGATPQTTGSTLIRN